ncbi:hypothetical protein U0E23_30070 [Burkholderia stagnalis]|uniref:hypothetical protein n=1 Tax=Burkholderia stagnalis TaxID=1503054 RepID=UPI002AB55702|nr:hypothetical protein [Burkholderia stagnalis]MDY7806690.1 hypothetical protein [Burkholderia stagnalis]
MASIKAAPFVLDDRTIGTRLDAFRAYCQRLPFTEQSSTGTWAQVLLGKQAGAYDENNPTAADLAWAFERQRLITLYDAPEKADQNLPAERAFLLALMGMLETPRALLNTLPAQYRALYYRQMLALKPREAQADHVTVSFTLADGVRELMLPARLLLDAGQDDAGRPLQYALDQPLAVNATRLTDMRWVVRDPFVPTGCRSRIVYDEAGGVAWPTGGVRLFEPAPAQGGVAPRPDQDRAVTSGRVIGSPVLAVAGGERQWTITLNDALKGQLTAELSIDNAWVKVQCTAGNQASEWVIRLGAQAGAPTPVTDLDGLNAKTPLLRLTSETGERVPTVDKVVVNVTGAVDVHCATDDGTALSGGGLPFGESAATGQGINLVSAEWWRLGPKLTEVTVKPSWVGLPTVAFNEWYGADKAQSTADWFKVDQNLSVDLKNGVSLSDNPNWEKFPTDTLASRVKNHANLKVPVDHGYQSKPADNQAFMVDVTLAYLDRDKPASDLNKSLPLFEDNFEAPIPLDWTIDLTNADLPASDDTTAPDDEDPRAWPWRVRLSLTQSFLQEEYEAHLLAPVQTIVFDTEQTVTTQVPVLESSQNDPNVMVPKLAPSKQPTEVGKPILLPVMADHKETIYTAVPVAVPRANWNAPYLPQWSGLQVNYAATDTQVSQQAITPFGYAQDNGEAVLSTVEADLYLGIDGIEPEQLLTLHWQLKSPDALKLEWQYLAPGDRWHRLPVADNTDSLRQSNTWSVDWPRDASRTSRSLPEGRMWVRGRAKQLAQPDRLEPWLPTSPWLDGVVTNAARATLVNTPFTRNLLPGSVTQALNAPVGLQSVEQAWPSTGGQVAETQASFDARVARRLQHRDRGLNNQDLQTLLREQYPGIRELAILQSERNKNGSLAQTVVVMPGLSLSDSGDPLRPGLSPAHLKDMSKWLASRTSPWLTLSCVNPVYVAVSVSWDIEYEAGVSRSVGDARVKAALEAAFVPWTRVDDEPAIDVLGRPMTQGMVRKVVRAVPGVVNVRSVSLNGSDQFELQNTDGTIAVLQCIPQEYAGVSVAWIAKDYQHYFGVTLTTQRKAALMVTMPSNVVGVSPELIDTTHATIALIDLDTGKPLPTTATRSGLWYETQESFDPTAMLDASVYQGLNTLTETLDDEQTDAQVLEQDGGKIRVSHFTVNAGDEVCGTYRLGVAITLMDKGTPDATLQSAQVGQIVTVRVKAKEAAK